MADRVARGGRPGLGGCGRTDRIRDGRISEEWAADDIAAIMNQLGVFSPPWLG